MVEMKACTAALFQPLFVGQICVATYTRFLSDRDRVETEI
jgi:hypothetical protein